MPFPFTLYLQCANIFTSSIMLLSDEDLSDKQLLRGQTHVIFQYIYKYLLWRGSERLHLLHRRARNHFLPTNSVLSCSKHLLQRSTFRSLQPMRLLHVLTRKRTYFQMIFPEKRNVRLTQRYHEQHNDCVHNSQIYNERVSISKSKFIAPFSDATGNKIICFSRFWFNKMYSHFALSINCIFHWKRTQSCEIYYTKGRLFCAPEVPNGWIPDRLVPHLRKTQHMLLQRQNLIVFKTLSISFNFIARDLTFSVMWLYSCEWKIYEHDIKTSLLINHNFVFNTDINFSRPIALIYTWNIETMAIFCSNDNFY